MWAGIGLNADGNIEYTKISAKRISYWLNVWVCMYWMDEIPTFTKLKKDDSDNGIFQICKNSLKDRNVINGIKKLVSARDDQGLKSDEIDTEVNKQIENRYLRFRKELMK